MLTAMFDFMVIRIPELTEHGEDDSGGEGKPGERVRYRAAYVP